MTNGSSMHIHLAEMSALPLREQLVKQLRAAILVGSMQQREQLPSIRSLAKDLRVGTITVQHAYEELEREGLLYARAGKGYFVAPIPFDDRREKALSLLKEGLKPVIRDGMNAGLKHEEIRDALNQLLHGGGV